MSDHFQNGAARAQQEIANKMCGGKVGERFSWRQADDPQRF